MCPAGYYCPPVGTTTVSGVTTSGGQQDCPMGYYCAGGNEFPIECPAGYYSWNLNQDECEKCPAGYYCGDSTIETWVNYNSATPNLLGIYPLLCPAGYYCPKGSYLDRTNSDQIGTPCPIGTFLPWEGAATSGNCITCPEGYECTSAGIADAYADLTACPAGFYCEAVSSSRITCPVGAYCPEGSSWYTECPAGTVNNDP